MFKVADELVTRHSLKYAGRSDWTTPNEIAPADVDPEKERPEPDMVKVGFRTKDPDDFVTVTVCPAIVAPIAGSVANRPADKRAVRHIDFIKPPQKSGTIELQYTLGLGGIVAVVIVCDVKRFARVNKPRVASAVQFA